MKPLRTCNVYLATVLGIQHVQCISHRYTSSQRVVCGRCIAPPLIVPRSLAMIVPSLLVANHRGAVPAADTKYAAQTLTPWGATVRGYSVPVARYGFMRELCDPVVAEGTVTLLCYGEPDWDAVKPLRRAAARLGATIEVAWQQLYDDTAPYTIAEYLYRRVKKDRKTIVPLYPFGLAHVVMAAIVVLVDEYGLEPGKEVAIKPVYPSETSARERNIVKNAVDYMCSKGDKVACTAAKGYHVPLWEQLQT